MSLRIGRAARARGGGLDGVAREDLERLVTLADDGPDLAERLVLAQALRASLGDTAAELDRFLLERMLALGTTIERVRRTQDELKSMLGRYQEGPWYPAVVLGHVPRSPHPRVVVTSGTGRRVVGVVRDVDAGALSPGDEVYLDGEQGLIVATSPFGLPPSVDTATFERALPDGRLLLRHRDELAVVAASARIAAGELRDGDLVRWDRATGMVFERLDRQVERSFLLEDVPEVDRRGVGGQDENLRRLLDALSCTLLEPERARRYGLGGRQSILLVGPPGGGKTLLARTAAAEIRRLTGQRCRFAVVKPGEFESPFVGETQARIRACFRELREAARDGHAILFLDEVESAGRIRGGATAQHDDKFLTALLAELDGFSGREGIAIIAATNRKDLIDGALLERLGDLELHVARPDMAGARAIFDIHLGAGVPYAREAGNDAPREVLVDLAVSRLYGPNGDNELCRLQFRDGTSRIVAARELMSGRAIEQLCRLARAAAFHREVAGEAPGVARCDVEEAVAATLDKLATTLTPRNCRAYLDDLPQDLDVVRVDRLRARPRRHRYATAA